MKKSWVFFVFFLLSSCESLHVVFVSEISTSQNLNSTHLVKLSGDVEKKLGISNVSISDINNSLGEYAHDCIGWRSDEFIVACIRKNSYLLISWYKGDIRQGDLTAFRNKRRSALEMKRLQIHDKISEIIQLSGKSAVVSRLMEPRDIRNVLESDSLIR